jgi:hypothetical protein
MWALPESPRWLAGHGRIHDAKTVLRRLRGHADVSAELAKLRTDIALEGRTLAPPPSELIDKCSNENFIAILVFLPPRLRLPLWS